MKQVDLSCDLGEGTSEPELENERQLWPLITSANIACGGHVGDVASMRQAVSMAERYGVLCGAHPSYPDREGFGRRRMAIGPAELIDTLVEQIEALQRIVRDAGLTFSHVKPHGALYNEAHHDRTLAETVIEAIRRVNAELAVVAAPGSCLLAAAVEVGQPVVAEAFADRRKP